MNAEFFGYMAAFLNAIALVPQAIRIIKTKDTNAISFWMYFLSTLSVACWLIYGLLLSSIPIIIKNILVILLSLIILYYKTRDIINFKKKK